MTSRTPLRALPSALKTPSGTPSAASLNEKAAKWKSHLARHGLQPRIYQVLGWNASIALVWTWLWAGGTQADILAVLTFWGSLFLGVIVPWVVVRWRMLSSGSSTSGIPSYCCAQSVFSSNTPPITITIINIYGRTKSTHSSFVDNNDLNCSSLLFNPWRTPDSREVQEASLLPERNHHVSVTKPSLIILALYRKIARNRCIPLPFQQED
jgi:hypothetical protein